VILLLLNPAAFVVAFLSLMGAVAVARDGSVWPLGVFIGVYVLAARFLPWWTRPVLLWRHWRAKKQVQAEANQFPTWPGRPE
jgi:hypothetical protein